MKCRLHWWNIIYRQNQHQNWSSTAEFRRLNIIYWCIYNLNRQIVASLIVWCIHTLRVSNGWYSVSIQSTAGQRLYMQIMSSIPELQKLSCFFENLAERNIPRIVLTTAAGEHTRLTHCFSICIYLLIFQRLRSLNVLTKTYLLVELLFLLVHLLLFSIFIG